MIKKIVSLLILLSVAQTTSSMELRLRQSSCQREFESAANDKKMYENMTKIFACSSLFKCGIALTCLAVGVSRAEEIGAGPRNASLACAGCCFCLGACVDGYQACKFGKRCIQCDGKMTALCWQNLHEFDE